MVALSDTVLPIQQKCVLFEEYSFSLLYKEYIFGKRQIAWECTYSIIASLFSKADGWVSDHFRIIIKSDDTKDSIIRKVWIEKWDG